MMPAVAEWRRREDKARATHDVPPLSDDAPSLLAKQLEACQYLHPWEARDLIERKTWAIDGFINGYVPKEYLDLEMEAFRIHAKRLLDKEELYQTFARINRPLTKEEERRRRAWQREHARRAATEAARLERKRQRALLREGHKTLTAIRRHLQSPARSPLPESRPAKTSPTS